MTHQKSTEAKGCLSCQEYENLSRRHFMGLVGGAIGAAWMPRVVLAKSASDRDVVVSIFLRGGADALAICPPFGEAAYYDLRPNLAIAPPDSSQADRAIDLDGFFGFAPSMEPLMEAYQDGQLLVVQACGQHSSTRSHFEAMHFMEIGQENPPGDLVTGWLGRHLQGTAPTNATAALRAIAMGAALPRTLVGAPQTLPMEDPSEFGYGGDPETLAARRATLEFMYDFAPTLLKRSAGDTFATIDLLKKIDFAGYQPAVEATYQDDELGLSLRSVAALIKAEVGVEAAAVDVGGWDTHESQGAVGGGMAALMSSLATNLAAFHKDLQSDGFDRVVVVTTSEFGRNAFENGSLGTDHGHGGIMFALGSGIRGGRVLANWPGLEHEQLYEEQDLHVTIDYRDVLGEILAKRLGNNDWRALFPDAGYRPRRYGVAHTV